MVLTILLCNATMHMCGAVGTVATGSHRNGTPADTSNRVDLVGVAIDTDSASANSFSGVTHSLSWGLVLAYPGRCIHAIKSMWYCLYGALIILKTMVTMLLTLVSMVWMLDTLDTLRLGVFSTIAIVLVMRNEDRKQQVCACYRQCTSRALQTIYQWLGLPSLYIDYSGVGLIAINSYNILMLESLGFLGF